MNMLKIYIFFPFLLILAAFGSRLELKSMKIPYLNVSSSFLQNSVLIMQYAGVARTLCLAWLVHKSANMNQKDVADRIIYKEYLSFKKSRRRGDMQCTLPSYCAKLVVSGHKFEYTSCIITYT